MAYRAYQPYQEDHCAGGVLDGFTTNLRFFLFWGQVWREKS